MASSSGTLKIASFNLHKSSAASCAVEKSSSTNSSLKQVGVVRALHKKPTLKPQQPASWHSMVCAASICKINEKLLGFFFCVLHCHGAGRNYITHMARQAAERNPTQTGNFRKHSRNTRILTARSTCNWIDQQYPTGKLRVLQSAMRRRSFSTSCSGFGWFHSTPLPLHM